MVKIENMALGDMEQIVELEKQCFSVPWTYKDFEDTLKYENVVFLVAKENEQIVGYGGLYMSMDQGDIANIAVAPSYRRKGIADLLMKELFEEAKNKSVADIFLEVRESNQAAINLYKKYGFEQIGIRKAYYTNPTENGLLMMAKV